MTLLIFLSHIFPSGARDDHPAKKFSKCFQPIVQLQMKPESGGSTRKELYPRSSRRAVAQWMTRAEL